MKLQNLKHLFAVALMGVFLSGCSSMGKQEAATDDQVQKLPEITPKTESVDTMAVTDIEKMSFEQLKAFVAGKVVYFDFDRSDIHQQDFDTIRANALMMLKDSSLKVTISGHCDERGTREYNLALGERRGNAIRDALIAEGVESSRIDVISYGEDMPVDLGHNEAAWAKNRRGEFKY